MLLNMFFFVELHRLYQCDWIQGTVSIPATVNEAVFSTSNPLKFHFTAWNPSWHCFLRTRLGTSTASSTSSTIVTSTEAPWVSRGQGTPTRMGACARIQPWVCTLYTEVVHRGQIKRVLGPGHIKSFYLFFSFKQSCLPMYSLWETRKAS